MKGGDDGREAYQDVGNKWEVNWFDIFSERGRRHREKSS